MADDGASLTSVEAWVRREAAEGGASPAAAIRCHLFEPATRPAAGVVLVLIIGAFIWRSRRGPSAEVEIQQLIRQIAELDAMHDQGQINHDLYRRQRADLKARLATLMSESQET